jgi:hypothetical protein
LTTTQTINQGTLYLAAQEGGEDALVATGLYPCEGRGHMAFEGHPIFVAAMSRLLSLSCCCDHPSWKAGAEAAEGVSEEMAGISTTAPTPGAVG